jgi:predicted nucleotidyltransferase
MGKGLSAVRSQKEMVLRAARFVNRVAEICRARGLELVEAYVVGSRARGDYLDDSDIDLVLVIDGVDDLNQVERMLMFEEAMEGGVDFIVLSPREWSRNSPVIEMLRREAIPLRKLANELQIST